MNFSKALPKISGLLDMHGLKEQSYNTTQRHDTQAGFPMQEFKVA